MRIELVFERNTTCLSGFQVEETVTSFIIGLYRIIEETCVSLRRKPSMLEEGACTTLLPCGN
jgi:hypothetical protein